jgi:hypothetical protein
MYQESLIRKVLWTEYNITPVNYGTTWESIELEDGVEKPPKDEFDEKVSNFVKTTNVLTLRKQRNRFLDQTDKYIVADYPHPTPEARQAWLDYRQALRDLPANTEDPTNPVWPVRPDEVVPVEETPVE